MDNNKTTTLYSEEYVSFENAKILKELGYDEYCSHYYNEFGSLILYSNNVCYRNNELRFYINIDHICVCPTQSMVMRWLRDNYNIFIVIDTNDIGYYGEEPRKYHYRLYDRRNNRHEAKNFSTYEEAVESAITRTLELYKNYIITKTNYD